MVETWLKARFPSAFGSSYSSLLLKQWLLIQLFVFTNRFWKNRIWSFATPRLSPRVTLRLATACNTSQLQPLSGLLSGFGWFVSCRLLASWFSCWLRISSSPLLARPRLANDCWVFETSPPFLPPIQSTPVSLNPLNRGIELIWNRIGPPLLKERLLFRQIWQHCRAMFFKRLAFRDFHPNPTHF